MGSTLTYKSMNDQLLQPNKDPIKESFYKKLNIREIEFESEVLPHLKTSQEIIQEAQDKYLHIKVEEMKKKKHKNKLKVRHESKEKGYEQKTKKNPEEQAQVFSMVATAYISFCDTGCIGTTKTGYDVSNTIYYRGRGSLPLIPL